MKQDYIQRNKIIRSRGYAFERKIVESFLKCEGWDAKRLGGTTTTMPDIFATNTDDSICMAIECKSTESTFAYIVKDQIDRCIRMVRDSPYKKNYVVFAFKFKRKQYSSGRVAPLSYFIFGFSTLLIGQIEYIGCTRKGTVTLLKEISERHWQHVVLDPTFTVKRPEDLPKSI